MARTIDQIEGHIEDSRADLRSNLDELGEKVRSAVDWRQRFRSNPGAGLALAFASGLLLARLGSANRGGTASQSAGLSSGIPGTLKSQPPGAWDEIKKALMGVLASKIGNTLADVLPGFKDRVPGSADDAGDGAANADWRAH
jgi:hypothetical protein